MKKIFLIGLFFLCSIHPPVSDADTALGIMYPGITLKMVSSKTTTNEIRFMFDSDMYLLGYRGYGYSGNPKSKTFFPFIGFGMDFNTFKGSLSEGYGMSIDLFIGEEMFLGDKISLQFDIGPTMLYLYDSKTGNALFGFDIVANFGLNYYFGKGRRVQ